MWHVICDIWYVTCNMWHLMYEMRYVSCDILWHFKKFTSSYHRILYLESLGVYQFKRKPCIWIMWCMIYDMQFLACDLWYVICDIWFVTHDMWHLTRRCITNMSNLENLSLSGRCRALSWREKDMLYTASYECHPIRSLLCLLDQSSKLVDWLQLAEECTVVLICEGIQPLNLWT